MANRFLVLLNLLAIGAATALDYDYKNLNAQIQATPHQQQQHQQQQHQQQHHLNNAADDINSFSAATTKYDSQPTPDGYDYTPQAVHSSSQSSAPSTSSAYTTTAAPSHLRIQQQQHQHQQQRQYALADQVEYWPPAKYEYSYGVNDAYTGDIKSHQESRDGNYVRGSYSVVDPDGYERIVTYTVDDVSGFNAIVNRKPYVSTILKSTPLVELHQKEQASATINAVNDNHQQNNNHHNNVDSSTPIQQHASYATPPSQQQADGPYP